MIIKFLSRLFLLLALIFSLPLCAEEVEGDFSDYGITVDLREPTCEKGIISTDQGGVIQASGIRIQARRILHTRKPKEDPPIYNIVAEGDLMIEFGDYVFVGDRLEYDFLTKTGVIYNGRTMAEPWFFGGGYVFLAADGSYYFSHAYVTTSENYNKDWELHAAEARLSCGYLVEAKNVQLKILNIPVFWLPTFKANLDAIFDSPVRYNIKWGGRQGHRFGLVYELFSWERWRTFLRLDYRIKRGPGGGIETYYRSLDRKVLFESINYVARDSSIIHPSQRLRYRFQGVGDALFWDDKISAHLSYDKLSDIDMPTDYNDRGLELDTAGRTELLIRRQEDRWISNLNTRVRINNFQTLKQEFPTFETWWRPFVLGKTGIVSDLFLSASYLDFAYGNNQLYVHDYNSTRLEFSPILYRRLKMGEFNITPEAGAVLIAYGNSPQSSPKWLALGKFECVLNTHLTRHYDHYKHVITPYAHYSYYTMPTVSPNDHYIFDIEDGWYRLNMTRFGVAQSIYHKGDGSCMNRPLFVDLYANAFVNTPTIPAVIPKVYGNVVFSTFSFLRHSIHTGWDFIHNEVDHYNVRTEWTISADVAIAAEYRHRSSFDWRKGDHTNYILDSFRTISQMRHSLLSDRRDTLLVHFFCRIHPDWAFEFESRSGWNRRHEPPYTEFEIDLLGTLRSAWNIKISYQHKEDDDRVSVYMTIGIKRPDCDRPCHIVPCLGF